MSKRIDGRVIVHRRVDYQHARGQGDGWLVDLSLQGCRITGAPPLPCGARLQLQLGLPDQAQPLKIELAAIRWVKNEEFGVSFLEVAPDARARLAQVVQLLQEAQQPEAPVIHVSAFMGSQRAVANRGVRKGFGKPTNGL